MSGRAGQGRLVAGSACAGGEMSIAFAFVHHANQYLITEGYDNRHGLRAAVGSIESKSGFSWIGQPASPFQYSPKSSPERTLIEAIAWHQPEFLVLVRELLDMGLIELVGSCYAQNIMRFFSYEHNLKQLNEELLLYKIHLGVDPASVKVFWPPERVWDTRRMSPVLRDCRLLNHGYQYVLLDDRLLLPGVASLLRARFTIEIREAMRNSFRHARFRTGRASSRYRSLPACA